ncbi:restriction endonuclease [Sulfitobacter sp. BSw21498]|jgi:restriction system protein|uniref:restriction endonuclease n=1 Tax=Sulfitobacter sp. BSw21498 TaxID=664426 RepID=UPI0019D2FF6C|nr:restriction endonuclease [Sulfitobacter sp. BSw21498]
MFDLKDHIPTYQKLMRPVLKSAEGGPRKISEVVEEISNSLNLSSEQRELLLPSGKQTVIANRIHWARSYLKQAGLVKNTQRGWFELTETGFAALKDASREIDVKYLEQYEAFQEFRQRSNKTDDLEVSDTTADKDETPDEQIEDALKRWNKTLSSSLLKATQEASPAFFEQLIVELLIGMGYGGSSENAGRALGKSGDNGIDGVIDQDPLGVDQIYIQAKRYASENVVGSGDIRDFFGALSIHKATKGIFVTTSKFTTSAKETTKALGGRIVLIDGERLANLMITYGIGCRQKSVVRLMELDETFFDEV